MYVLIYKNIHRYIQESSALFQPLNKDLIYVFRHGTALYGNDSEYVSLKLKAEQGVD